MTSIPQRNSLLAGAAIFVALMAPRPTYAEFGCAPGTGANLSALVDEIASLPEGGWMRANANRYDEVWTPPDLRPSSGALLSTPSKIIQAWSSFAWDCRRGDLLIYGGGHANYSGNDTYRWRASTRAWERMSLPSNIRVDQMGNTTAIDGPFAAPPAAHTYDNNMYLPMVDRFLVVGGSAWNNGGAYEMATGPDSERITGPYTFDLRVADGAKVGGTTGSHVQTAAPHPEIVGGMMWQNRDVHSLLPATDLPHNHTSGTTAYAGTNGTDVVLLTARQGLGTAQHLFRYEISDADDATTDKVSRIGRFVTGVTGRGAGTYDPDLDVYVRTAIGSSAALFFYWDLSRAAPDNPNVVFPPLDLSGSWRFDRGYGMDFDPVRGQYLLWGGTGEVWVMRAPATLSSRGWTIDRMPSPGTAESPTSNYDGVSLEFGGGVLGKWKYIPELDAFIGLQDTSAGNVWIYKPIGWTRPGTTPAPTLNLDVTPQKIFAGDSVTVAWRSKGATTCVADGGWTGAKGVKGSQTIASVNSNATFGLRCDGPGGSIRRTVIVAVDPLAPPTIGAISTDGCVNSLESTVGLAIVGTGKIGAAAVVTVGTLTKSSPINAQGTWQVNLSSAEVVSLPDGLLSVSAEQTSGVDTTSPTTTVTFLKDTVAPGATTTMPQLLAASDTGESNADGVTRDATPTYQGVSSTGSLPVVLLLNGAAANNVKANSVGVWKATIMPLSSGTYRISAAIADTCGNRGIASPEVALIVDTLAPAISLDAVALDNRINALEAQQSISIRGASESQAAISLRVSNGNALLLSRDTVSTGAWLFELSAGDVATLPDGSLTLAATATDTAGNNRLVKRTITKDTAIALPTMNPVTGDDVLSPQERATPVIVSGLAEPKASVTLRVNGWSRQKTVSTEGIWSMEIPTTTLAALPGGPVLLEAQATDLAGNVSLSTSRTITVNTTN